MADILPTNIRSVGSKALVETTLTGTDTLTYTPNRGQILVLRNPTAGALSPVIDGAGGTTVVKPGIGSVDVSGGFTGIGSIAAGESAVLPLDPISDYLVGAIAVTGATGLVASLLTQ